MRDLRARIAARHGVELSTAQIEELAARRLDAILAPDGADAALLETLRKGAAQATSVPGPEALPTYTFGEATLYESGGGLVRFLRRLFRPLLRMLFDPDPLVEALGTQARINAELGRRAATQASQQAEWNALHYELIKRVVTESARLGIDVQELAARVEALSAKTDFNERRVREAEGALQQARPPRPAPVHPAQSAPAEGDTPEAADGGRRRRRRRRGRRGDGTEGQAPSTASGEATEAAPAETAAPDTGSVPLEAYEPPAAPETTPVEPAAPTPPLEPATPPGPPPEEAAPAEPAVRALEPDVPAATPTPEPDDEPKTRWRQVFSPPGSGEDTSGS